MKITAKKKKARGVEVCLANGLELGFYKLSEGWGTVRA
jgi:hypothetical protein